MYKMTRDALADFSRRVDAQNTGVYFLFGRELQANRFRVTNVVVPTRSSVSEYDEAMLEEFIGHTLLLVNTLGYKAFEKIGITVTTPQMPPQTSECEFFIKSARGAPSCPRA